MKDFLKKLIERKKKEREELQKRSDSSEDIKEVRSIGVEVEKINEEIREAEEQLKKMEAAEQRTDAMQQDGSIPAEGTQERAAVMGTYTQNTGVKEEKRTADKTDTKEYRTAFMEYVCRNTPIPAELRVDATTSTGDVGAVIPTTIMNEIVQKMESYGNVYKLVRKLNVQGGVAIPVLTLKPTASWIGEEESSEDQKIQANKSVTFSYFGVECKIAQTLLANVTTLQTFQEMFVPLATEAIVKAVEITIFKGNGTIQPLGILKDSAVPEENVITITPEEFSSWKGWHTKVKAKMKKAYRKGTFFMNQATFDGYIDGMEDKNGQPIGRTNYGINGEETYRFMGKNVETVEDECIASWDDAKEGDVIAVFFKPEDYAINSNMQMITVKWTDNDNNKIKNKCIMICDGKLIDPNGVLIIKKGIASA